VESEGAAGEQSDAGVDRLDESVGKPVLEGDLSPENWSM